VQLRPSPYGGVSAVTLIPRPIVGAAADLASTPALPAGSGPASARRTNGTHPLELETAAHPIIEVPATLTGPTLEAEMTLEAEIQPPMQRRAPGPDAEPNGTGPLPSRRATAAATAEPRHARQEIIDGGDGLPKRVRQTNMAPQLWEAPAEVDIATQAPTTRSPEELRAMMTSFQLGMTRGRREAEDDVDVESHGSDGE
jgi:hypothetical protein